MDNGDGGGPGALEISEHLVPGREVRAGIEIEIEIRDARDIGDEVGAVARHAGVGADLERVAVELGGKVAGVDVELVRGGVFGHDWEGTRWVPSQ